jgi:hypothetical protein
MKTLLSAASAAVLLLAGSAANAAAPLYGFQISDSSEVLSAAELASFLGAPDDDHTGIGSGYVTYDFGDYRLVDGAGQDFNVYEVDGGIVEFNIVDILVSLDGVNFWNVEASALAAVDLDGDEAHGNASFRRSYDLGDAVANLGVSEFRYLRVDGTSGGAINGNNGFDLDAVAAINYIDTRPPTGAIPEPATWAMMILGFGAAGSVLRRRRAPLVA